MHAIPAQFTRESAIPLEVRRFMRLDGWQNALTGLGVAARDKRLSTTFGITYALTETQLDNLFHDEAMIRRVCELPAKEMTREWIEIADDEGSKLTQAMQALKARRAFTQALTWARLTGAGIIVMMVDDGRTMDQPLNMNGVTAVKDLIVLDRFDLRVVRTYQNPNEPKYGEPEIYAIRTAAGPPGSASGQGLEGLIHETRCLHFEGALTSRERKRVNEGWSESIVHSLYEAVRDFAAAFGGMAHLLQDYSQGVYKIKGLAEALAADEDDMILDRMQLMDMCRSIARAIVLDEKEDFDRITTPVTGLADLIDKLAEYLSALTDIPITLLMGRSPAGMNATGEGDRRNWYAHVRSLQETELRDPLSYFLKILAKAVGYKQPKKPGASEKEGTDKTSQEIAFEFRSLYQPSDDEKVKTRNMQAQTDKIYHEIGALDTAEIVASRFGGPKYSIETTIDREDFDPSKAPPDPDDKIDPLLKDDPDATPEDTEAKKALAGKTGVPSDKTVQDTAMNGAQMASILEAMTLVRNKEMEAEAAINFVILCAPAADEEAIRKIFNAITPTDPPKPEIVAPPGAGIPGKPAAAKVPPTKKEGDA